VLYQNEDIVEAAVIGVKDQHLRQVAKACIALRTGSCLTAEMVQEFCGKHLAGYKIPKQVEILQELPKNPTGKILKKALANTD